MILSQKPSPHYIFVVNSTSKGEESLSKSITYLAILIPGGMTTLLLLLLVLSMLSSFCARDGRDPLESVSMTSTRETPCGRKRGAGARGGSALFSGCSTDMMLESRLLSSPLKRNTISEKTQRARF